MRKQVLLISFIFGLIACQNDNTYVFNEYKSLGGNWSASDTLKFEINTTDTIHAHHLFFSVRATQKYPYNNIFVIAELGFPNGKTLVDTLEYDMAYPDGSLMGQGGSIKESLLWYKQNVRFLESGKYSILLRQATRKANQAEGDQQLEGIEQIGLAIEKSTKNE